jgi:thiol-disulfide isomerase/thioredoxin
MAETPSTMLSLGTVLPDFSLTNAVDGTVVTSAGFEGSEALLVMFICNHCPFVKHVQDELGNIARDYLPSGVAIVAINSNAVETHPQDGPSHMKELAQQKGWEFPFLFDGTQRVAKVFRAACTPDFFLFDRDRRLVYRGQLDGSRPGNDLPVTGSDLRAALDAVLVGGDVSSEQLPSLGCNIKWKAGNEPDYF